MINDYPQPLHNFNIYDISIDYICPESSMRAEPYWFIDTGSQVLYLRMQGKELTWIVGSKEHYFSSFIYIKSLFINILNIEETFAYSHEYRNKAKQALEQMVNHNLQHSK